MAQEALAYVVRAHGQQFELQNVQLGVLGPDEVLVKIKATGLCHTDVLAANGDIPVQTPIILGHEGVGEVVQTGAAVSRLNEGDLVLLSFASCSHCFHCVSGHPALCRSFLDLNLFGTKAEGSKVTTLRDSTAGNEAEISAREVSRVLATKFFGQSSLSSFANVNVRSCVQIDRSKLRFTSGAEVPLSHLAPFGCGFMTGAGTVLNVCKPPLGSSIAVYGVGAVGLAAITAAAHLSPANTIIAVDVNEKKLEFASAAGATLCVNSTLHEDLGAGTIRQATDGRGLDFALDTTGNVRVIESMLKSLGTNGSGIQIAGPMSGKKVALEPSFMVNSSATYRGVIEGDTNPATFLPALINHYVNGRFPVGSLIKEYRYDELDRALADVKAGFVVKAVLVWD